MLRSLFLKNLSMRTSINFINNLLFPLIPEDRGQWFKRMMWRLAGVKLGKNVKIRSSIKLFGTGQLIIGDNCGINSQVTIISSSKITIGNNVGLAPRTFISTGTHAIDVNTPRISSCDISKNVTIGDGCWICINATILPGVTLGKKCVVAAGAVVTKSFTEDKILIAGVPAKKIKNYE